jgi:general secretion pathway protein H
MSTVGKSNNPAGFTLIELAMVVLLLAIFAGLSLPLLAGFGENSLSFSARRLAGTVKYLYNEAALSGRPYRLIYDLDQGTYQAKRLEVDGELTLLTGIGKKQSLKGSARFKELSLPDRGNFTHGEISTEILPIGWIEETIIHLIDVDHQEQTLHILPFTGTMEIYEGYREF